MRLRLFITFLAVMVALIPAVAQAQFRDAINDDDMKLMQEDWDQLVDENLVHIILKWENPETGRYGSREVLKNYKNDAGRDCKTVRYIRVRTDSQNEYTYVMNRCLDADGEWKFQ